MRRNGRRENRRSGGRKVHDVRGNKDRKQGTCERGSELSKGVIKSGE